MHLLRAREHRIGQHDEVAPHFLDEPRNDNAVEHPIGMIGDDDDRTGPRDFGERGEIVAYVKVEFPHRGSEKALTGARMALILQIHPFQLRLPGGALDEADQAALDRGVGGVSVTEQIFVHSAVINRISDRPMTDRSQDVSWRARRTPEARQ